VFVYTKIQTFWFMRQLYYSFIYIYIYIYIYYWKVSFHFKRIERKLNSTSEKWRSSETSIKFQFLLPHWEKNTYSCGKINRLMYYGQIAPVNYAVYTQHTNSTVANVKLFNILFGETCSNHWPIRFYFTVLTRNRFLEFPDLLFEDTLSIDMGTGSISSG